MESNDGFSQCNCGSMDCPGWKIVVPLTEDERRAIFTDDAPQLLKKFEDLGRAMAMAREKAFLDALEK